jgi:hypothetical protein
MPEIEIRGSLPQIVRNDENLYQGEFIIYTLFLITPAIWIIRITTSDTRFTSYGYVTRRADSIETSCIGENSVICL